MNSYLLFALILVSGFGLGYLFWIILRFTWRLKESSGDLRNQAAKKTMVKK